jgi:hypothetical protein
VTGRTLRFGRLLVLILAVYVVMIGFGSSRVTGVVRLGLLGLVLLAAVRTRPVATRWTTLSVAVALIAIVTAVLAYLLGSGRLFVALVSAAVLVLVIASIAAILLAVWHRPAIDVQTVGGALAVYLLLALLFAALHQMLAAILLPPYLNGVKDIADAGSYLYFSVITLSTVGYGDLSPACPAARAVAMSEALVGQLYLVAIVGTVIGNLTGPRRQPAAADRPISPDSSAPDEARTRLRH